MQSFTDIFKPIIDYKGFNLNHTVVKLDRGSPFDIKPSTDKAHTFVHIKEEQIREEKNYFKKYIYLWQKTHDM